MKRPAYLAAGILVAVLGTSWVAQRAAGTAAADEAEAAQRAGDRVTAIVAARRAALARCPGCSAPARGFATLAAVAKEAESKGDDAAAVAAWRAARAAALATLVLAPDAGHRDRADAEIARLEHRLDIAAAATGGQSSPAAAEERLRQALAPTPTASPVVYLLLALGGLAFVAGAGRFVRSPGPRVEDAAIALAGILAAAAGLLLF